MTKQISDQSVIQVVNTYPSGDRRPWWKDVEGPLIIAESWKRCKWLHVLPCGTLAWLQCILQSTERSHWRNSGVWSRWKQQCYQPQCWRDRDWKVSCKVTIALLFGKKKGCTTSNSAKSYILTQKSHSGIFKGLVKMLPHFTLLKYNSVNVASMLTVQVVISWLIYSECVVNLILTTVTASRNQRRFGCRNSLQWMVLQAVWTQRLPPTSLVSWFTRMNHMCE